MAQENNTGFYIPEESIKFGIKASTNGTGLFFRTTFPFKNNLSKALDIDLTSLKNPKEKQIINNRIGNPKPFTYNKINRLYNLRLMGGLHYLFAERNSKNSINIGFFAVAGPNLGIIKPIFLDVNEIDPNNPNNFIIVARRYNPEIINTANIVGNSSYFTGINTLNFTGGLSFKTGAEFNWGNYGSEYKSIEVGFTLDWMPSKPSLIHKIENKTLYSGFYISFALGKNK
ncbi:MAG: hypothetical protein HQ463_08675 [Bacteroidetes bacterium]|nr:hypothetical protein [Bacteroidota bacterium]